MRQEQILTKGEYVRGRRNTLDTILFYSHLPFFIIFGLLGIAAWNNSEEGMRLFAFLEIPALMTAVACRMVYAEREAEYIEDYYNVYLPSTK